MGIIVELNMFWQAILLLVTGMLSVYYGMKWKESGDSKHALWLGIMIMCTVMNIRPFV